MPQRMAIMNWGEIRIDLDGRRANPHQRERIARRANMDAQANSA